MITKENIKTLEHIYNIFDKSDDHEIADAVKQIIDKLSSQVEAVVMPAGGNLKKEFEEKFGEDVFDFNEKTRITYVKTEVKIENIWQWIETKLAEAESKINVEAVVIKIAGIIDNTTKDIENEYGSSDPMRALIKQALRDKFYALKAKIEGIKL